MPKIPDFSKITGKLDLQGIVDSVKSIISPANAVPESIKDDPLVPKIAEISVLVQQLMSVQAQQTEALNTVNSLLNSLYRDLEAIKKAAVVPTTVVSGTTTTTTNAAGTTTVEETTVTQPKVDPIDPTNKL